MAVATATTPGFALFKHQSGTFVACSCLRAWLPVFERVLLAKGLIKECIDILQLTGDYAMSGGNHRWGGVWDIKQYDPAVVAVAREMGAEGSWMRNMNFADGSPGNTHTHGVLSGCPHNYPAAYQITAQHRGYNGMGQGPAGSPYAGMWGYGGKDTHPKPSQNRTYLQGMAWGEAEIARLAPKIPTQEEILMSITVLHPTNGTRVPIEDALWSTWYYAYYGCIAAQKAAAAAGVDIDEVQVAKEIATALSPVLVASLKGAAPSLSDDDVHRITADVLDTVGTRLAKPAA